MFHRFPNLFFYLLFLAFYGIPETLFSTERILNYKSTIEVKVDGDLDVIEEITVLSEGRQIKRGIFRTFPTSYKDRYGNRVRVDFQIKEIIKDGLPEPYHIKKKSNGLAVYMGQKDIYLRPGNYKYILKYNTNRQIGFFEEYDELYYNAVGQGWNFPIDNIEVNLILPGTANIIQQTAYTGLDGSRNNNYTFNKKEYVQGVTLTLDVGGAQMELQTTQQNSNVIQYKNVRPFSTHEGLTIAVSWPKGIVMEPSQLKKISYLLKDNSSLLILLTGLVLLLCYYYYAWNKVGRDPEKGAIVPHYNPPGDFSPAAVRYLLNMCYDKRSFTAAIVNMARKGHLDIIDEGKKFKLHRKSSDISELTRGEKVITEKLFNNEEIITLENKQHSRFRAAIIGLKKELNKEFRSQYFNLNLNWLAPGGVISLVTFGMMIVSLIFFTSDMTPFMIICVLTIIGVNILFAWLIKAPTLHGRKIMDKIEGLKMYLSVAEKERLNLLNPPDKTPELFEKFLPYAIALGVENEWGDQFSSVFSRLDQEGGQYHPSWYHGHHLSSFGVANFTSSMGSSFSSAINSAASPPGSSSASGGGGFSGGGGGGGGGGGW